MCGNDSKYFLECVLDMFGPNAFFCHCLGEIFGMFTIGDVMTMDPIIRG
jgi:hypothetical protein